MVIFQSNGWKKPRGFLWDPFVGCSGADDAAEQCDASKRSRDDGGSAAGPSKVRVAKMMVEYWGKVKN